MMINLCVIHNNEHLRLQYLRSQVETLAKALEVSDISMRVYDVGPEASGMADKVAPHSLLSRLKRAWAGAAMFAGYERDDPRKNMTPARYLKLRYKSFKTLLYDYRRSIRIEQEVLYAHGHAWKIASKSDLPTIVLESDAVFPEHAIERLVNFVTWALPRQDKGYFFADLAGGCSTAEILNSWCLEEQFGMKCLELDGAKVQCLPKFTSNTVGGYFLNAALATAFDRLLEETTPMLPPDWAISLFAMNEPAIAAATCIHLTPTILRQGSADGTYDSTIGARIQI